MENHKKIYKTKLWQETRKAVIERDRAICFFCGKIVTGRATVHHLVELTEDNYTDFDIAYNMDNLVTCHPECHDMVHERFSKSSIVDPFTLEIDYSRRKV